eukprot:425539-Heterocapsa_arctica.AAC.1
MPRSSVIARSNFQGSSFFVNMSPLWRVDSSCTRLKPTWSPKNCSCATLSAMRSVRGRCRKAAL